MAATYELQLSSTQKAIIGRVALDLEIQSHPSLQLELLCLLSFEPGQQGWFREPARWREQQLEPAILPVVYLLLLAQKWSRAQAWIEQYELELQHLDSLASWCLADRYRAGFDWLVDTYAIDSFETLNGAIASAAERGLLSQASFLASLSDQYAEEIQYGLELNRSRVLASVVAPVWKDDLASRVTQQDFSPPSLTDY